MKPPALVSQRVQLPQLKARKTRVGLESASHGITLSSRPANGNQSWVRIAWVALAEVGPQIRTHVQVALSRGTQRDQRKRIQEDTQTGSQLGAHVASRAESNRKPDDNCGDGFAQQRATEPRDYKISMDSDDPT